MKILIATDGSEYSQAAIEEGCRMFADGKTPEIKVVSVFEKFSPWRASLLRFRLIIISNWKMTRRRRRKNLRRMRRNL